MYILNEFENALERLTYIYISRATSVVYKFVSRHSSIYGVVDQFNLRFTNYVDLMCTCTIISKYIFEQYRR